MAEKRLRIEGMTCQHCVKAVTNALREVAGVRSVDVSLADKLAVLSVDEATFDRADAEKAIAEEGYSVAGDA